MDKFWKEFDRYLGGYHDDSGVDIIVRIVIILTFASLVCIASIFIFTLLVFIFTTLPLWTIVIMIGIVIATSVYKAISKIITKMKERNGY